MVTRRKYSPQEIRKDSSYFSPLKAIIETAFYENQVVAIKTVEEAYQYSCWNSCPRYACDSYKGTRLAFLCTRFINKFRSYSGSNG